MMLMALSQLVHITALIEKTPLARTILNSLMASLFWQS